MTFDKSLQQRLDEFKDVLSGYEVLSASLINKEWTSYLEYTLDPNGWQAVWKIPRLTCELLKIPFPSVVLVLVLEVHYNDLTATVRDKTIALNMYSTANALDMLRFFYTYIYMPWDSEEDNCDWKSKHLETRLRLYYDMKNGIVPRATSEHIHSLLTEARRLQSKRTYLESELGERDEADYENDFSEENLKTYLGFELTLPTSQHRKIDGSTDVATAELVSARINKKQQVWLKNYYPSETVMFSTCLASKLETSNSKDIFILNESTHTIRTTGALEKGGVLRGIGETVLIENVTIDAKQAQCAILVRSGTGILKNCKIVGDGSSSTHQGIIVLAGAKVELIDCEITGFSTSIVGNSDSTISLQNCEIHDVHFGMKIYDKCCVNLKNSSIHDCREYGVVVETEDNIKVDGRKIGNFDTLSIVPEVKIDSIDGNNNSKGDVVINKKCAVKPVENLFSDPEFDPTVIESSDEDMDGDETLVTKSADPVEML
ncbi:hypothetical protein NQ317_002959 [Molorchus minor]|uniref:Right handed beta helix domain-containing protein n=1 Tax=Molorchus minor TaxID=1323400 RepID=A0ABQ9JQ67_9CUCU|nr:hypothetical protein NQ317_002959 [Molorchus minor]